MPSRVLMAAVALVSALDAGDPGPRAAPAAVTESSIDNRLLAAQPGDTLIFGVGDRSSHFHVSRQDIQGDRLYLHRLPGHLRGHVGAEPVDLALSTTRITGVLGDRTVELDVLPGEPGFHVAGHFGFREVRLTLELARIEGEVGPCRYELDRHRGTYEGEMGCGGQREPISLLVPVTFVARPPAELAAMLVAVLAR